MYKIIINGEVVSRVLLPNYVKYDNIVDSFETCDEPEAEAILVNVESETGSDSFYADLENKSIRHPGFPVARVERED